MLNPNGSRKIIVNADDFGMSAEVNHAVVEAFHKGAISSATLITQYTGFSEAWRSSHHSGVVVWDTQSDCHALPPWNRFCSRVLQSSEQHKITNIWPDEDPILWFLRGRAGDSCGCSGDVEIIVHLNSESTGSISDARGYIEIGRWFSPHQLVSYAS